MKPQRWIATLLLMLLLPGILGIAVVSASDNEQRSTFVSPILVANTSFLNVRTGPGANYSILATVVGGTEMPVLGVANDGVWYLVNTVLGPGWVNVDFTLARGDFTNVPLVDASAAVGPNVTVTTAGQGGGSAAPVTTTTAPATTTVSTGRTTQVGVSITGGDMFTTPDNNGQIIRRNLQANLNAVYPVLNAGFFNGELWYLFTLPNVGTGWMNGRTARARPLQCSPSDSVAVTTIAVSGLASGTEGYVIRIVDNIADFELIDKSVVQVPFNNLVGRSSSVRSFCEGVVSSVAVSAPVANVGQGGGAPAPATTLSVPVPQITNNNRVIVNTGNLNVRSGPGGNYTTLATLPGGTELAIVGRAPDDEWYLVQGSFGLGWVDSEFTIFRGDYASVPLITEAYSGGGFVTTIPVATNPGQGGGAAAPTTTVTTTVAATGRTSQVGVSITGGDMFTTPDNNGERIRRNLQANPNAVYPVLNAGMYNGEMWFLFTLPNVGTGWMNARTVRARPLRCTPSDSVAVTSVAVSGLAAGTEGYVIRIVDNIADFELIDKSVVPVPFNALVGRPDSVRSFCEGVSAPVVVNAAPPAASAGQGGGGAVVTAPIPQVTTTNRVIVNTGNLNVRSGPGGNFSVITSLPGGTELAIVGRAPDDEWFLVQGGFGLGWVDSEFAIFRGDYASVPLIADAYSGGFITSTLPVAPVIVNPGQGGGFAAPATTVVVPVVTTTNRVIVNTGNLNIRSGPGAGFSTIATVPGGTELPVIGRAADGVWHLVQGSFGQGWINIEFAIFRGDYASVPILNIQG
jgi:uncharacterized protein YgiM (DUF1202 family)